MILPTKTAKAKVFNIHGSVKRELKREKRLFKEAKKEKSFKKKIQSTTPPK
jgi:hypothetical protein